MRNNDSFGGILRQVREENGYSLDSIADRLRLRTDILRAIEECDFNRMPPRAYTKNMVGAYARLLGLDGAALTEMYLQQIDESEAADQSFGFVDEAKDVGVSMRRPSADSAYSTRLTSRRGASGSSVDSDLDFVSPFRSEGRGTISKRSASSYVPNPAASSRLDDYPRSSRYDSRADSYGQSARFDEYPRSSRYDSGSRMDAYGQSTRLGDYPRSSRSDSYGASPHLVEYPRSGRYDMDPRSDGSARSSGFRGYDAQGEYPRAASSRYDAERSRGGRYGQRSVVNGYEALDRGSAGSHRQAASQQALQDEYGSPRRQRGGDPETYAAHSRATVASRGVSHGGFEEESAPRRGQLARRGSEAAKPKGLSGGGRYDSIYSSKSPVQLILSKLPLIIGAILVIVLAIVLVSCISGRDKAADDAALNTDGTPITGVDDPAASGLDTGESQQPSTETAVPIAPTAAVFSYEVPDGNAAYVEIYLDGSKSPILADELQGPTNGNYDVTGTLEFVTTNPDGISCMVDGEKIKLKDKDGDGVYTYTVDFKKILKKWKEKNLKDDSSTAATDTAATADAAASTDAAATTEGAEAQAA